MSGTVNLTNQQAGASLITVNATAALTIVYPTCMPGFFAFIQETGGANNVTVEINGNSSNTATITAGKMASISHTIANGGVYAVTPSN